ncbi:glycosyltransferase family 2 protein [Candidatus Woesearchaeota archaeon]|nr:glycosyltransferase family 2 protein [Candidatus Woesearchaeota archaeon]
MGREKGRKLMNKKRVWIVIAAFNEEKSISDVVWGLRGAGYRQIVVVDDCSTDNTARIARQAGVYVLSHVLNRGQGASLKTGIDFVLATDPSPDIAIVTFDADGQHRVGDIGKLLRPVLAEQYDVALGSRFLTEKEEKEVPFMKCLALKLGVVFTYVMYGIRLTDSQNGLRVLSRKAAETIAITEDRMEHASQILEEIARNRLRFVEVPVFIKYTNMRSQSWTNSVRIGLRLIFSKFFK